LRHFLRKPALVLSLLFSCMATAWVAFPRLSASVLISLNNASAGLRAEVVSTNVGDIHYLEGGKGETVLLVHGIYARKEHWVELARRLVKEYHVIAIDLPGFGENAQLSDDQYLLDHQQANLLSLMQELGLKTVHIGANSMGAYIAALLAKEHPEKVASLSFIGSPLGVPTPIPSDMDDARAVGVTPLVVRSHKDFTVRNDWLAPSIPYVPGPILRTWAADEVAKADHNTRIWEIVHTRSEVPSILDIAPLLAMPTLIIWCRADRIFHISGAALLDQTLPASQMTRLENCGHVPMLDRPNAVASRYLDFLASQPRATEGQS
jgi:pimeloyl-ACP methyl ester carboxylesterase